MALSTLVTQRKVTENLLPRLAVFCRMAALFMLSAEKIRQELAHFGRLIHQQGFVSATDGNLSVRLDENTVLATPTGMSKGMMAPEDMVLVDMGGRKLFAQQRDVSSEILMHLTIYRMRPDVRAVVHAHPCTATGFACAGMALDLPVCSEVVITLGAVPLAEYATTGTAELSEALVPHIPDYDAILLANHGAVTYGVDLLTAYQKMEAVEHFAKILLVTHQLGQQEVLDDESVQKLVEARQRYAGNRSLAPMPAGPLKRSSQREKRSWRNLLKPVLCIAAIAGNFVTTDMLNSVASVFS
jgi:L-fuculose-phosphate aldolase